MLPAHSRKLPTSLAAPSLLFNCATCKPWLKSPPKRTPPSSFPCPWTWLARRLANKPANCVRRIPASLSLYTTTTINRIIYSVHFIHVWSIPLFATGGILKDELCLRARRRGVFCLPRQFFRENLRKRKHFIQFLDLEIDFLKIGNFLF